MPDIQPPVDPNCGKTDIPIDPSQKALSDKYWSSLRQENYCSLRTTDSRDVLKLPWGPRIEAIIDPKLAANMQNGRVRVMALTPGSEVEIASATIYNLDKGLTLTAGHACDQYVIRVTPGRAANQGEPDVKSYFFARVFECSSGGGQYGNAGNGAGSGGGVH